MTRIILDARIVTLVAFLLLTTLVPQAAAQAPKVKSYMDYLDSYYETYNVEDLKLARNVIRTELDTTEALRFQSYYYSTEIEYLLSLEDLKGSPHNQKKLSQSKALMLQLYSRYLDAYYKVDPGKIRKSNIPGNTAFLVRDIMMASEFVPNANSFVPLIKNIIRRADRDSLYNRDNSFIASVNDMITLEYPNLFGTANLVKAVWLNDKFIGMEKEDEAKKEQLRKEVNYYASNAADTLRSRYGLSIAYFLLAETSAQHENDMAWDYFRKCIDVFTAGDVDTAGFYARNYNREIYLATAVAFVPTYSKYLYENGRYSEILSMANYLTDLGLLDRGKTETVTKETIFWGEKSIRQLQDAGQYEFADEIFKGLQGYYKSLDESKNEYGVTPEG
jgi:hypothetical protein